MSEIRIIDEEGRIVESFVNVDALYQAMQRRYINLQMKRASDMHKAWTRGYWWGSGIVVAMAVLLTVLKIL